MTFPMQAIERHALHATAVARLRGMITEGLLAAGSRLNERALCELLGISRTPLREALKILATEGLVVLLPHRGAQVARLSREDVVQTFELIGALEGFSGELACQRIGDDEIAELVQLQAQMATSFQRRDLPTYYRINHEIHERINLAAGNAVLTQTYRTLNARVQSLRFRSNFNTDKWRSALAEHEAILSALAARDAVRLRSLLALHLAHKCEAALLTQAQDDARAAQPDSVQ